MAELERRAFIRKAAVAGTAAWVAPTILAIRADASTIGSQPTRVPPPPETTSPGEVPTNAKPSGSLAYTGSETIRDAAVGITLGAVGATMLGHGQPDWDDDE